MARSGHVDATDGQRDRGTQSLGSCGIGAATNNGFAAYRRALAMSSAGLIPELVERTNRARVVDGQACVAAFDLARAARLELPDGVAAFHVRAGQLARLANQWSK